MHKNYNWRKSVTNYSVNWIIQKKAKNSKTRQFRSKKEQNKQRLKHQLLVNFVSLDTLALGKLRSKGQEYLLIKALLIKALLVRFPSN